MPEPLTYRLMRDPDELHALASQWRALYRADPDATPFHSPDWLLPWWHNFGEGPPLAVEMRRGSTLAGLLPMYIYRNPQTGERQMLPIGVSTSDYLGGVFAPGCTAHDIAAALDLLCTHKASDGIFLSQIKPGSRLAQAIHLASTPGLHAASGEHTSTMPAVPVTDLPQKIRRNAMYYRNRAARIGALRLHVADYADWHFGYESLLTLHSARWQQHGEPGVLADPRIVDWHREAIPLLLREGLLRLCSLQLNGDTIGVLYSLIDPPTHAHRTQYFYLTGYSPQHADLRPGTLLLALAIEHAASEGVQTIDMLRGEEGYKQIWHMEQIPTLAFVFDRRAAAAQAA